MRRLLTAALLAVGMAVPASAQYSAVITSGTQTVNGSKTFADFLTASGLFRSLGVSRFGSSGQSVFGSNGGLTMTDASLVIAGAGTFTAPSASLPTVTSSVTVKGAGGLASDYGLRAGSATIVNGLTASSGTFTATGNAQYSIETSSGIRINAGVIRWPDGSTSSTAVTQSGGGGGHTLSTATLASSGTVTSGLYDFTQRTRLVADAAAFEMIDDSNANATVLKVKGYQVLASTSSRWCSSIGVSVGNGLAVGITTVTINTGNNSTMVCFSGTADTNNGGTSTRLGVMRDGAWLEGMSSTKGMTIAPDAENAAFCIKDTNVSAGQHSYVLMGSHDAGGTFTTSVPQAGSTNCAEFNVTEMATGGNGFAVPASTRTFLDGTFDGTGGDTTPQTIPGSTITLTMNGGKMLVSMNCPARNKSGAGFGVQAGFFVNGAYPTGLTSKGVANLNTNSPNGPLSFTYLTEDTYSGSTSVTFWGRNTNGGDFVFNDESDSGRCHFSAMEVRNAPGTGDVSSNGANNFTGENTFASLPRTSTPTVNAVYSESLAKAWITFVSSGTVQIQDGFNFDSNILDGGTGLFTVYFLRDFATTSYSCHCQAWVDAGTNRLCNLKTKTTGSLTVQVKLDEGTDNDAEKVDIVCYGRQ